MGVRQRGHSGFSLHHSVIQFLNGLHKKQKMRQGENHANGKESSKKAPRHTSRIHGHRK